ncbi:MAG: metallophosphatase [Bacteroidales bacterium]|jgi:5'-nucleotidase|nr:metallophosphatase [Bacteroidales bacterium]
MKKTYLTIFVLFFFAFFSYCQEEVKLVILHTNDMHSQVETFDDNAGGYRAGNGGMVRISTYVNKVRAEEQNVIVLDAGDFSQGSPYYNLFSGRTEIDMMNAIGYDVATFGNHEFDLGMDNLLELIELADFPFVNANYDFSATVLKNHVKPYIIIEKSGLRIGVFGLGVSLKGFTFEKNIKGIVYKNTFEVANELSDLLKNKLDCDLVICLSHLGFGDDEGKINDYALARQSEFIDVIIGGHSHTFLEKPQEAPNKNGKKVYIAQTGSQGINVGRLDLILIKN